MPPSAAPAGSANLRGSASSPTSASRLISKPTTKKKTAIKPSLIQRLIGFDNDAPPIPTVSLVAHAPKYRSAHAELAQTRASAAAASRTMPPAASA